LLITISTGEPNFLADYHDLSAYYEVERKFDPIVAKAIGNLLGIIHSHSFRREDYYQFLGARATQRNSNSAIGMINRLSQIGPAIFGVMPRECLQFFKLYQRFPGLPQAIAELGMSIQNDCLIHLYLR
jgi:hypothetical protein